MKKVTVLFVLNLLVVYIVPLVIDISNIWITMGMVTGITFLLSLILGAICDGGCVVISSFIYSLLLGVLSLPSTFLFYSDVSEPILFHIFFVLFAVSHNFILLGIFFHPLYRYFKNKKKKIS